MPEYRAYVVGHDGHFVRVVELVCADDQAAVQEAEKHVDGHDVELWQQLRHIAKLDRRK